MARINVAGAGSESQEQASLMSWWQIEGHRLAPNAVLAAIPNGGARSAITGARLKREGVVKGMPDLILCCARSGRHALFIEMKRRNGRVSEAQRDLFPLLEAQGYGVAICRGWISAMDTIKAYLAGNWEPSRG
jgi:hypothetical protein